MKNKIVLVILSALLAATMLSGCLIPKRKSSGNGYSNPYDDDDDDDDDYDVDDDDIDYTTDDIDNTTDDVVISSTDWADIEILGDTNLKAKVTPTHGIPDDFIVYGDVTYGDVCDAIYDNCDFRDSLSNEAIPFDVDMYNKVCTMIWFSSDEFKMMASTRDSVLAQMAYIATLSYEFSSDNFDPEYCIYDETTNTYEFHGVIDKNNIGRCIISFTDTNGGTVNFEDAMCGDEIVWKFDFNNISVYQIGLTEDTLSDYPTGGFLNVANYFAGFIDGALG
jgi:hypothetical protein